MTALTFLDYGLGLGRAVAHPGPRCTKCNRPPVNGQCTNHRIAVQYNGPYSEVLMCPLRGSANFKLSVLCFMRCPGHQAR